LRTPPVCILPTGERSTRHDECKEKRPDPSVRSDIEIRPLEPQSGRAFTNARFHVISHPGSERDEYPATHALNARGARRPKNAPPLLGQMPSPSKQ
jgi:hypothetical protein